MAHLNHNIMPMDLLMLIQRQNFGLYLPRANQNGIFSRRAV
jgi:hypothetical protein